MKKNKKTDAKVGLPKLTYYLFSFLKEPEAVSYTHLTLPTKLIV